MAGYETPLDVANRALQHCRADRISSFSDFNVEATETGLAYDKVRQRELRRNRWRFAIRRVVLRALTTTTQFWTPPVYVAGTAYSPGAIVTDSTNGDWWQAMQATTGHDPLVTGTTFWEHYFGVETLDTFDASTKYFAGEIVISGGLFYLSLISGNQDTPPTSNWLLLGGTALTVQILYPIGTGPRTDVTTNNIYRLPHGFLRQVPTDPKGFLRQGLGISSAPAQEDWLFEGNWIVSADPGPISMRYIADITDVPKMDAMFLEAFSAALGQEIAPRVASPQYLGTALQVCARHYKSEMDEAATVNGIEIGAEAPPVDPYITCRL